MNEVFDFADKLVEKLRDISSPYQELKRYDNLPNFSFAKRAIDLEEFIRKEGPAPIQEYIRYVSRDPSSNFSYPEADYFSNLANNIVKFKYRVTRSDEAEDFIGYLGPKVAALLEIAINL